MNAQKNHFIQALCLLTLLSHGAVQAAAIFDPDTQPVGYVGMPEVTNNVVTSGTERMFTIDYNSQVWSGNLHSYALSSTGAIDATDQWDGGVAGLLPLQNLTGGVWNPTGRKIVTVNVSGVPFLWSSLSSTQKTAIDSVTAGVSGSTSSPVLNFIRGDRSNEDPNGNKYRTRSQIFGDVIHSTPVYCNAATCGAETVFVGANDGMLHAINATDGTERFAYIPSLLIPKLKTLTANPYVHKYFVDGNMDLRQFSGTTILVGTLGAGGKGLYALNVSNAEPSSETDAASKILWEASNASSGYANLGYTYGQPRLVTLNNGTNAVILGNGYNNTGSGGASLFVINASTGAVISEISAGAGTPASPNGLSSPTIVDTNTDGKADIAYAGDIDGNLWKFDLVANTATLLYSQSQAITMAPAVRSHPKGGFMVSFVTGRMFTTADASDTAIHYAYGIWDGAPAANDTLLTQVLTEENYTGASPNIRVRKASNNIPDWTPGAGHHKGWKTALPAGERVVGDGAYITGSIFLFMSTNPTVFKTATPPYENWWMQINALTGGDNGVIRYDLNGDAAFSAADKLPDGAIPVGRHMGGGIRSQLTELNAADFNVYHANYDKNGDPVTPSSDKGVANGHFDVEIYYNFASTCPDDSVVGVKASGGAKFNYASDSTARTVNSLKITVGTEVVYEGTNLGSRSPNNLGSFLNGKGSANYTISNSGSTITVKAKQPGTAYNGTLTISISVTNGNTPGYTNKNNLTGGTNSVAGTGKTATCKKVRHIHEYDDVYDKTGLNMLDASDPTYDLKNAIPSTTTPFKVIAQNQYLSPAVNIHIGKSSYQWDVDAGYIPIKNFTTSSMLNVADLPTYTRADIGSLAFNMPVNAFDQKDWWDGALGLPADVRVGLHPTQHQCVWESLGSQDGAMFQPVIPPSTVTATGNGTMGYNSGTTSLTATGARHNGALAIQIIKADTPQSAIEMSIPGRPEYGWRVKSEFFTTYVLAEYSTFWHYKAYPDRCYGTSSWTKLMPPDTRPCGDKESTTTKICDPEKSSANGTDPKIGAFGGGTGGGVPPGSDIQSIEVTENADGTVTVVTTYKDGTTSTTIIDHGVSTGGAVGGGGVNLGGVTTPPEVLGRVNWREMRQ